MTRSVAPPPPIRSIGYRRVKLAIWVVGVACGIAVGAWYLRTQATPRLGAGARVAVASLDIDAALRVDRAAAATAVRVALGRSPRLSITPASDDRSSIGTACPDAVDAVIVGRVEALASQARVTLEARSCPGGQPLALAQSDAASPDALVQAIDDAAVRLRVRLGERP